MADTVVDTDLNERLHKQERNDRICKYIFYVIFAAIFAVAVFPSINMYAAMLIAPLMLWLFFYDDFYLLAAIFLFFGEQLVVVIGVPIARVYTVMIIVKAILFDKSKRKLNAFLIPAILVLAMYAMFALPNADNSITVREYIAKGVEPPSNFVLNAKWILKYIVDFTYLIFLASKFQVDKKLFQKFCFYIVICAIASGIYGFRADNIYNYVLGYTNSGEIFGVERYMGSFNDPNYTGFFMNLAIFFTIKVPEFRNRIIRTIVLTVLYYFLVASGSISGILFNICGMIAYIILRYRMKSVKVLFISGLAAAIVVFLALNIPQLRSIGIVQSMITRVESQFSSSDSASVDTITSGRETHWVQYMEYYKEQDTVKKLFGGNIHMTAAVDPYFTENFGNVAHQAYIGFLLCFGAVGTFLFLFSFAVKTGINLVSYFKYKEDYYLLLFICSFIWIFYGFGFDYFADWRFMLFYFL